MIFYIFYKSYKSYIFFEDGVWRYQKKVLTL